MPAIENVFSDLKVRHLMRITGTREMRVVDAGPGGQRMYTWVDQGAFEGERLRGTVQVGPSGERAEVRSDGVVFADVHLLLVTDDGAEIIMRHRAMAAPQAYGMSVVNFPTFETAHPNYAWLNTVQAITLYAMKGTEVTPRDVYQIDPEVFDRL